MTAEMTREAVAIIGPSHRSQFFDQAQSTVSQEFARTARALDWSTRPFMPPELTSGFLSARKRAVNFTVGLGLLP
jgi:hypothetical protein